jgi:hypothetical protein
LPHHPIRFVLDHNDGEVRRLNGVDRFDLLKASGPHGIADVRGGGEVGEEGEVAARVIGGSEGTEGEATGDFPDAGGDERVGEEVVGSGSGHFQGRRGEEEERERRTRERAQKSFSPFCEALPCV